MEYLVKVRLANNKIEYIQATASDEFDAKQQVGWDYIREGVVIDVEKL